ncbi:type I-F CRISPR-associated protein Csy2 [Salmonella enterica]|nr:type I-F CRISPR-associated protein Csy2 [Salmonella enterica]
MSKLIILRGIHAEYANAVAGFTYGFPAITAFMGFTHALSRKLEGLTLHETGVIAHRVNVLASGEYEKAFHLTRNPLGGNGEILAFNDEGKMHYTITLIIKAEGEIKHGDIGAQQLADELAELVPTMRIAGGHVTAIEQIRVMDYPEDEKAERRLLYSLLPGFALVDRSQLLGDDALTSWLETSALRHKAGEPDEDGKAEWERIKREHPGYLVPIMNGFRAVSKLYAPGEVARTRDPGKPFAFCEATHGIGEWISPHRFPRLAEILWRYESAPGWYRCTTETAEVEEIDIFADLNF